MGYNRTLGELDVVQRCHAGTAPETGAAICMVLREHILSVLCRTDIQGKKCGGTSCAAGEVERDEEEGKIQALDEVGFQMEIS